MDNQAGSDCKRQDVAASYVYYGLGWGRDVIVWGWSLVIDDRAGLGSLAVNDYLTGRRRRRRVMTRGRCALPGRVVDDVTFAVIAGASYGRGAGENDDG